MVDDNACSGRLALKTLIIGYDEDRRNTVADILDEIRLYIVTARNGDVAHCRLDTFAPDAVITDAYIPRMAAWTSVSRA